MAAGNADDRNAVRSREPADLRAELVGASGGEVTVEVENVPRLVDRIENAAAQDRSNVVEAIFERRDYSEVPATTAHAPEQVRVFAVAGGDEATVGSHDIHGNHVVAGKAVLADQPAHTAAKGQARDAGRGDDAHCGGETEGLRFT